MIVVNTDTSPRGDDVEDDPESYDIGKGVVFSYIMFSFAFYRLLFVIVETLSSLFFLSSTLRKSGCKWHSILIQFILCNV